MSDLLKYRIVIADDHPIVLNGIKYLLHSHESFDLVGVANSGPELLDLLPDQSADTLILDLNMPGYSYYQLLKQILVLYPKLKVIAFTAYNHPELVREVMDLGTHGFLCKTTGFQEIIEAVKVVHQDEVYIGKQVQIGGHGESLSEEDTKYQDSDYFLKEVLLTRRERDVLILVARGFTNQSIADRLFLSKHTIETHRKNIMRKMNFNSSAELIQFAVLQKMV